MRFIFPKIHYNQEYFDNDFDDLVHGVIPFASIATDSRSNPKFYVKGY